MTTSKKLFLIATLGLTLGSQFNTSAYSEAKITQVLDFTLKLEKDTQNQDIAQWLHDITEYELSNQRSVSYNFLVIIHIINTNLTLEEKIEHLSKLKTKNNTKERFWNADDNLTDYNESKIMPVIDFAIKLEKDIQNQEIAQWLHDITEDEAYYWNKNEISYNFLTTSHIINTDITLEEKLNHLNHLKIRSDAEEKAEREKELKKQQNGTNGIKKKK